MLPCIHLDAFIISCPISLNMLHLLVPYNQDLTVVIFASFLVEDKCKKNLHPASSVHFFPVDMTHQISSFGQDRILRTCRRI